MKISPLNLLAALIALIFVSPDARAKGVAAVKARGSQPNASAQVFVFQKVEDTGAVIIFELKGRKPYSVIRSPKVEYFEIIDNLDDDIVNDANIATYKKSLQESGGFVSKYKGSEALVTPYIELLTTSIENYENGLVRQDGKWITKEAYKEEEAKVEARYKRRQEELIMSRIDALEDKITKCNGEIQAIQKDADMKRARRLYYQAQRWLQKRTKNTQESVDIEELIKLQEMGIDDLATEERDKSMRLEDLKKQLKRQLEILEKQRKKEKKQ